jgi:hypothetical protein
MKASVVTAYGSPEVMKYQDMPDPKPGADDVLVRVAGIGVDPEDMLERNGDTKDRYRSGDRMPGEALEETFPASDPVLLEQRVIVGQVGKPSFSMVSSGRLEETVMEATDAAGNRMFRSSKRKGI